MESNSSAQFAHDLFGGNGQQVTRMVVNLILLLVGVPGNCLILRVYWTKANKTSTHVVIMALAWADLAVCLLAVIDIIQHGLRLTGNEVPAGKFFFVVHTFRQIATGFSVLVTSIIAADRYDCVCRANRRFFTHKRAKIAVWTAFLFAFIVGTSIMIAAFVNDTAAITILTLVVELVAFTVALLMILICYGQIYRTISNHVRATFASGADIRARLDFDKNESQTQEVTVQVETVERRVSTADNDQQSAVPRLEPIVSTERPLKNAHASDLQRKTTRMLFITSVVFLLTWLPFWIYVIMMFADFGGAHVSRVTLTVFGELYFVLLINNAVNPFIYGVANRRFRKDCREVLRKMKLC